MNHESRDSTLESALREICNDPARERVNWLELRRSITERAAPELARRRVRTRRVRIVIPAAAAAASLAASFALFLVASRTPEPPNATGSPGPPAIVERVSIDELLDADVPDGQFRAVLFGAAEADDLLLIAAQGEQP